MRLNRWWDCHGGDLSSTITSFLFPLLVASFKLCLQVNVIIWTALNHPNNDFFIRIIPWSGPYWIRRFVEIPWYQGLFFDLVSDIYRLTTKTRNLVSCQIFSSMLDSLPYAHPYWLLSSPVLECDSYSRLFSAIWVDESVHSRLTCPAEEIR